MVDVSTKPIGAAPEVSTSEQTRVVFASSVGTIFEWYDFYLYAVLAPFFAPLFFPADNNTAAILAAFATYAAGFLVRPFGAIVFGRLGDMVGRKYTFLITIVLMGLSTFAVGLLPTYSAIGQAAPVILVLLRLIQGLALGGEYGGAATYVAEHAAHNRRGYATSWIQTTATVGFFLALLIIGFCRWYFPPEAFKATDMTAAWRIPFLVSIILLAFSVYIRLKLNESPVFTQMKAEGRGSKSPIRDSFLRYPNNKYVLLALLGATAGQGVVWYTGQFYALFFLLGQGVDPLTTYELIGLSLLLGTPFFIFFGWLSDKIGRLKIILAGCLIAAVTYFPLFNMLAKAANPALYEFQQKTTPTLKVDMSTCNIHLFPTALTVYSQCDKAKDLMTAAGLSFKTEAAEADKPMTLTIGDITVDNINKDVVEVKGKKKQKWQVEWSEALVKAGAPAKADPAKIDWVMATLILWIMVIYVTMVYGPIAAFLVELFPTNIRYTSMSLPYHIGNGWYGGMLPLIATAVVAATGNIYAGLWYPIIVSVMTVVIGALFLRDNMDRKINE
jgi:MFS family permease